MNPATSLAQMCRAHHDQLVSLVAKMLLLVPKLRAAKSDGDRAIDALVYEQYGLTPEEIALIEPPIKYNA